MKIFFQLLCLCVILGHLSACTSVVWNGGIYDANRAINTQNIIVNQYTDQLYAVGSLPTSPHHSGSMVMMGKSYWYVLKSDSAQKLLPALSANLSQRYQLSAPYSTQRLDTLPVTVHDNQQFSSDFCLDYQAHTPKEQKIMRDLAFQPQANLNHFRQCYATTGHVYRPPQTFMPHYSFQKRIPVQLTLEQNYTQIQADKLAVNILLTPMALAVDTVSGMIMLPILMIGDLF